MLALGLFGSPVRAAEILPVSEVRTGMKGHGLTVVKGHGVERFEVEVLGVVRNAAAGRSVILVALSGLDLGETGVVAGMSGSPVYLGGKLAGAVASGWGFSKRAIAGVTPIEAMASIVPPGPPSAPPVPRPERPWLTAGPSSPEWPRCRRRPGSRSSAAAFSTASRGRPPSRRGGRRSSRSTPRACRPARSRGSARLSGRLGVSESNLALLGSSPASVAGPAPSIAPATLLPGASVTAYLVRGDLQLGATGTVTEVYPDGRFVAFGHPFLGAGELELPVARPRW